MKSPTSIFIAFMFGITVGWYGQNVILTPTTPVPDNSSQSSQPSRSNIQIEKPPEDGNPKAKISLSEKDSADSSQLDRIRAAIDLAESSTADELELLIGKYTPIFPHAPPYGAINIYIERLLSLDPNRALSAVRATHQMKGYWFQYFHSWGMQDPGGAIDYFHSIQDLKSKNRVGQVLLTLEGIVSVKGWLGI